MTSLGPLRHWNPPLPYCIAKAGVVAFALFEICEHETEDGPRAPRAMNHSIMIVALT
jgi:hypothetical protein